MAFTVPPPFDSVTDVGVVGARVSFVAVVDLAPEVLDTRSVEVADIVMVPSLKLDKLRPTKCTVPAPAVAAAVGVSVCALPASVTVSVIVSLEPNWR